MTASIFDDPVAIAFPHRFREHLYLDTGPEDLTPQDFRINAAMARRWCAQSARGMRDQLRAAGVAPTTVRMCVRETLRHGRVAPLVYGDTPNPHPLRLKRKAERLDSFAGSRWQSRDTEYYSACGWDDYCGEIRDDAAREARALWAAAIHTEDAR